MPTFNLRKIPEHDPMVDDLEEYLEKFATSVNINFGILARLLYGGLDSINVREGGLSINNIRDLADLDFDIGEWLKEIDKYFEEAVGDLGELSRHDAVERALLGETILEGGYLRTGFVDASRIDTGHLNAERIQVDDLTALTSNFTLLRAGSEEHYMRIYAADDRPFFELFQDEVRRLGIVEDMIQFFDQDGYAGGFIFADSLEGQPAISLMAPWNARVISPDFTIPNIYDRYAVFGTEILQGVYDVPPVAYMRVWDQYDANVFSVVRLGATVDKGGIRIRAAGEGNLTLQTDQGNIAIGASHGNLGFVSGYGDLELSAPNGYVSLNGRRITVDGTDGPGFINFKTELP